MSPVVAELRARTLAESLALREQARPKRRSRPARDRAQAKAPAPSRMWWHVIRNGQHVITTTERLRATDKLTHRAALMERAAVEHMTAALRRREAA